MKSILVNAEISYQVLVNTPWKEELLRISSRYDRLCIIAPDFICDSYLLGSAIPANASVLLHADGEAGKSAASISLIWEQLGEIGLSRADAIVAIGGGVTTDLAGFAAATWLRGVDWFAIPTTLAGMVDASVGGKTGINTTSGKNMVGAFYSPQAVIIDPTFLESLSDRDFSAGLAEVIKSGFIADSLILTNLQEVLDISGARGSAITLIEQTVSVKANVVSADFKESKLREVLNFGHTLGHAIEKDSSYELRHGEAVAIGLVFAAELSSLLCALPAESVNDLRQLLTKFNLPTSYPAEKWETLLAMMYGDKKSRGTRLRFIGLSTVGNPEWIEDPNLEILALAYERISS